MRRLFYAALFVLLVLGQKSYACTCGSGLSPGEAFAAADAVIVGYVKKTDPEINKDYSPQIAYVQVERTYKGYEEAEIVLHQPGHSCSPTYRVGGRHLFYVNRTKENRWEVFGCGRSRALANASDDLMYLNALPESAKRTRLSGTIRYDEKRPSKGLSVAIPLGVIKVKIHGNKRTWEVYTDGNGVYEMYDLPPGTYKIEPEIPAGMKIWLPLEFGPIDLSDKRRPRLILGANGGAGVDFFLRGNNVIKGKVFGEGGQAMPNVCLDLVPADVSDEKTDSYSRIFGCTKAGGDFELKDMPPGSYLIVANKDGKLSGSEPFPATYYPGFFDKQMAAVITIGQGENLEEMDIYIPSQLETITIQGVLTYADGRPVAREAVKFKASEGIQDRDLDASNVSDDQGRFSLTVLKGTKGKLYGSIHLYKGRFLNCPSAEKLIPEKGNPYQIFNVETAPIEIEGDNDLKNVKLSFSFPFCEKRKD